MKMENMTSAIIAPKVNSKLCSSFKWILEPTTNPNRTAAIIGPITKAIIHHPLIS